MVHVAVESTVSNACDVDLSKLKCFKCQKFGHISVNCPERKERKKATTSR